MLEELENLNKVEAKQTTIKKIASKLKSHLEKYEDLKDCITCEIRDQIVPEFSPYYWLGYLSESIKYAIEDLEVLENER